MKNIAVWLVIALVLMMVFITLASVRLSRHR